MQAPDTQTTAPTPLRDAAGSRRAAGQVFRAFGDHARLSILAFLADRERWVGELVAATGQSQPNVSNHLGCLRWCGFVVARREHRSVYYAIADDRVLALLALARTLLVDNERHVACCDVLGGGER